MSSSALWRDGWRRLKRNRAAMASAVLLIVILGAALFLPLISPYSYYAPDWNHIVLPPGWHGWHSLGTDDLGRDLLVRTMWGCRISLLVGLAASVVTVVIGVLWGATAGYVGGRTDALMMRCVDVLYSVPFIPFVIMLTAFFGRDLLLIFVAIGAVSWLDIARIVRGQTLALKNREFIEAARVSGVGTAMMIRRHMIPNLIGIVIIYATLTIPAVILFEAFLSFLGLGVQSPMTSLGSLVAEGAGRMQSYPHLLLVPAVFLAAIIYAFNYLGDGLRDALDPRDR
jgi:oligopeptide transport system permease protein